MTPTNNPSGDLERVSVPRDGLGYPTTLQGHLETARQVLQNIAQPQVVDGYMVAYSASDDVPEDIHTALSYVEAAIALAAAPAPSGDGLSVALSHQSSAIQQAAPPPARVTREWNLDMDAAPRDRMIIAMARYPSATAGSPTFVAWSEGEWWEYSRHAPECMVCWAWMDRDVLPDWPAEPARQGGS